MELLEPPLDLLRLKHNRKGGAFMSTVTVFSLLVSLAFIAGGCFGYAVTTMIDTVLKDRTHP